MRLLWCLAARKQNLPPDSGASPVKDDPTQEEKVTTLNETRARQGKKGFRVLYILIASFILLMAVWGLVELVA